MYQIIVYYFIHKKNKVKNLKKFFNEKKTTFFLSWNINLHFWLINVNEICWSFFAAVVFLLFFSFICSPSCKLFSKCFFSVILLLFLALISFHSILSVQNSSSNERTCILRLSINLSQFSKIFFENTMLLLLCFFFFSFYAAHLFYSKKWDKAEISYWY